jgi:hypothetical protein
MHIICMLNICLFDKCVSVNDVLNIYTSMFKCLPFFNDKVEERKNALNYLLCLLSTFTQYFILFV